ncbi:MULTISPECIES: MurR/RpiR family transcriptional regulator [Cytobacillus]|uniref:RpiR family transcriptional regulator n=3 Tax=Cytobacillus TaxID=2675230 RepID=A0A160M8X2_9BACI|nr:MurR/RpiR family transcriptional regulator [Cytobacillus oceanisediminis]MBY0156942.1 MurR/RpiR family transcriptional regulator [Cytobacillus firmus]AND39062.1 RpiR family transcriptional regulator [Cytobacillus oceanisediminis 2691]MBU8768205.1 MurR/RpiR family transcriptional regulator [Cytobacillus oceanisediminis]MCM3391972.1 MurR/RpiR family transcriptional regulator [Cytobacillus oceanisediminis]MCM3404280.1 MurR/RpiR family transcriptional regulator [Cytobacillus oceanisediminis]
MDKKTMSQLIKESYSSLSPGQRKAAEFIMEHADEAVLLTAFQVGKNAGVSETTVIRLAYALGFSGYSQMQDRIRKEWLAGKQMDYFEDDSSIENAAKENLFRRVIDQERKILRQLLDQVDEREIWKAIDALIRADRVYVGGFGSSFAAAYWFYYTLKQIRGNVYISSPNGFLSEDVCDLTDQSAVVIFSFPRYRKEALKLASFAERQDSGIIAITDRQLSPIGQLAAVTLTTDELMDSGHHSAASVISLLEVLIAGIDERDHERIAKRQQELEILYAEQERFFE